MKHIASLIIGFLVVLVCASSYASDPVKYRRPFDIGVTAWNFFDHDSSSACKIYTCTTGCATVVGKTYDGHGGIDYAMTTGTKVVAGASGVLHKWHDGCNDIGYWKNPCGEYFGNYVRIKHADNMHSIYAHMKKGTVLTGTVGVTPISCGQQVGLSASSGSSTDPHLHFELRMVTNGVATSIDPYGGPCSGPSYWTSISGVAPGMTCQVSDDHGNTINTATTLPLGSTLNGKFESGGDIDMFRFTTTGGVATVKTFGSTDPYCYLLNSSGSQLAENDDSDGTGNCKIIATVASGTYYVKIRHYNQTTGVGSYQVNATVTQATDDHGNSFGSASTIYFGQAKNGKIEVPADVDFFKFTTSTGNVEMTTSGSMDSYCYLYTEWGGLLEQDDDDGQDYNCRIVRHLSSGTYYVQVRHYSSSATGTYQLAVNMAANAVNPVVTVSPFYATVNVTVNQSGSGFTPYGTVWLYFQKPDGTQYAPVAKMAGSSGSYIHTYTVISTTPKGTFWYWAVDGVTGKGSSPVSYYVY